MDLAYTRIGDFDDSLEDLMMQDRYWESPLYNIAKNSLSLGGITAGALEINQIGNLTPWRTGDAFKNAKGWYRTKEGLLRNLSNQNKRGAARSRVGAKNAKVRSGRWSKLGKGLFYISAAVSIYDAERALSSDDSNQSEVVTKAAVDIFIGAVGVWGGPIGWVVAGTYFILDVSGAFGDWGQPSGLSMEENSRRLRHNFNQKYGAFIQRAEIDFEVECAPSEEEIKLNYLEERAVKIDNLEIKRRRTLFERM